MDSICLLGLIVKLLDLAFGSNVPFCLIDFDKAYLAGDADLWLSKIKGAFQNM